MLASVRQQVRPGSFPLLLAAGVASYALHGVASVTGLGAILVAVGQLCVAGASLYVLSVSRPTLLLGVATATVVVGFEIHLWPVGPPASRIVEDLLSSGFQLWVLAVVLRAVFQRGTSQLDAVVGALAGFLLLLMMFMRLHGLVEALAPGSYASGGLPLGGRTNAELTTIFQYFSTVTLTTVGYGDIVPVGSAARLAAGFEAITGQLYLAVAVATLVGRVASRERRDDVR